MKIFTGLLMLLALITVWLLVQETEGRRGGSSSRSSSSSYRSSSYRSSSSISGGSSGGSYPSQGSSIQSRSSSISTRYVSSSTRYSSVRSIRVRVASTHYHSNYGGSWYAYGSAGHVYGFPQYTRRTIYVNYNRAPVICFNDNEYTMPNGTYYEAFICPMEGQPDSFNNCCGPINQQYCC